MIARRYPIEVTPYGVKYVIIEPGINDFADHYATTTSSLADMCTWVKANGTTPVLMTVVHWNDSSDVNRINSWIRQYAANNSIQVIDAYAILEDPANPGYQRTNETFDGLHPNQAGVYRLVANINKSMFRPDQARDMIVPSPSPVKNSSIIAVDDPMTNDGRGGETDGGGTGSARLLQALYDLFKRAAHVVRNLL